MFKHDVLCIGSATVDDFLNIEQSLKSVKLGDKVLVNSSEQYSGGGATNSAAALAKLGLKVKILTKLGDDHAADLIIKELKQFRLKNICLHRSKKNTDHATLLSSSKEKDRIIYVHKGASQDLSTNDFKQSQLKAKWIYLATLLGKSFQTAKKIVQYAEKKKINLLFNPSLYLAKKRILLRPILKATKILVLNQEEAQALSGTKNKPPKLLFDLHKLGPEIVVITNGPKKIYALKENIIYSLTPPKIKVVHTAGSGDAFTAGLLAGIIKNYTFTDALKLGQANANSIIQHLGTKNKLLTENEAQRIMKRIKIKKC